MISVSRAAVHPAVGAITKLLRSLASLQSTLRVATVPSNQGDKEMMTKTKAKHVLAERALTTLTPAHLSHVVGGQAAGYAHLIPPDPC